MDKRAEAYKKVMARVTVVNAIKLGHMQRQPCEVCGDLNSEAHHDDYDQPLVVRWLCKKHHEEHHHPGKTITINKSNYPRKQKKNFMRLPPANAPRQLIERIKALTPEHGDWGEFVRTALTREAERREQEQAEDETL